jgi:hypothetical protein
VTANNAFIGIPLNLSAVAKSILADGQMTAWHLFLFTNPRKN